MKTLISAILHGTLLILVQTPTFSQTTEKTVSQTSTIEVQSRPKSNFLAVSGFTAINISKSKIGFFSFNQVVAPTQLNKINWWQTYTGVKAGKKFGKLYLESGFGAGTEKNGGIRKGFYVVAVEDSGLKFLLIRESGKSDPNGWTRIEATKATKNWRFGFIHISFAGNGTLIERKLGKSPLKLGVGVLKSKEINVITTLKFQL